MSPSQLTRLCRRWLVRRLVGGALFGAGLALPLGVWMTPDRPRLGLFVAGSAALGILAAWLRRDRAEAVARHLDRRLPELEDSCELLTIEPSALSPIGRLQRERAAAALERASPRGLLPWAPVVRGIAVAVMGLVLGLGAFVARRGPAGTAEGAAPAAGAPVAAEEARVVDPRARHRVRPPRYTGLGPFEGEGLAMRVPAGSDVAWRIEAPGSVTAAALETPSGKVALRRGDDGLWAGQRRIHESTAYRLVLERDGDRVFATSWARLEAVEDRPPRVRIAQPDRLVERESGALEPLAVAIDLEDDYGLGPVELVVTLASGSGEMVEFREDRRALPSGTGSAVSRRIATTLDLRALGLDDGGELYFRVEAVDNRRPQAQRGRSATRIVRVRGGAGASIDLGAGLPVLTSPDMFRSQRQIILDTEALVAVRQRLTRQELVRRSESIGFDQRALRMRYGTLLGDEFVSGVAVEAEPHDEDHGPEGHEPEGPGAGLEGLPEGLVHTHDSAEMATFFPDAIRTALREALAAMWEAEKALRSVEPDAALPHERRALERLQEIRRRSRVYVQRVGFDPPPLDPERARLRGELDEIRRPRSLVEDARAKPPPAVVAYLRLAEGDYGAEDLLPALRAAGEELARQAVEQPGVGLAGLGALAEVRDAVSAARTPERPALRAALQALWSLAPVPAERPVARPGSQGGPVAEGGR